MWINYEAFRKQVLFKLAVKAMWHLAPSPPSPRILRSAWSPAGVSLAWKVPLGVHLYKVLFCSEKSGRNDLKLECLYFVFRKPLNLFLMVLAVRKLNNKLNIQSENQQLFMILIYFTTLHPEMSSDLDSSLWTGCLQ